MPENGINMMSHRKSLNPNVTGIMWGVLQIGSMLPNEMKIKVKGYIETLYMIKRDENKSKRSHRKVLCDQTRWTSVEKVT